MLRKVNAYPYLDSVTIAVLCCNKSIGPVSFQFRAPMSHSPTPSLRTLARTLLACALSVTKRKNPLIPQHNQPLHTVQIAAEMRARNSVLQSSLPAPAPGAEASRSGVVPAGRFLVSGSIFESASADFRGEDWMLEESKRSKAVQRAKDQALFKAAFEKTTLESVSWPVPPCSILVLNPIMSQSSESCYCFSVLALRLL